ncbi:MAG: hypothetical protein HUU37_02930 [Bdellovibrionales bacterium]|nr:hypothetical protein [Bdellovibrionales bacterium]
MYFLSSALSGMRRRAASTLIAVAAGGALMTALSAVGVWSWWLGFEKKNLKADRTAAVFVEPVEGSGGVEEVLARVLGVPGVATARIVSAQEFTAYLKDHFPDLAEAVSALGEDILPQSLEVELTPQADDFARGETMRSIGSLRGVQRVDDGGDRTRRAVASLHWLSVGGAALGAGLWLVMLVMCLGHYQNVLHSDRQEILLIRSFGATRAAILAPWMAEGLVQSAGVALLSGLAIFGMRERAVALYNEFFGTIGYEPLTVGIGSALLIVAGVFAAALAAHLLGAFVALARGKIA